MGKIRLVGRLVGRDLRRRPGPALLLVLAITAATATLTLGLVLHGVTSQPYQQTRAATTARTWWPWSPGATPGSARPGPLPRSACDRRAEVTRLSAAPRHRPPGLTRSPRRSCGPAA